VARAAPGGPRGHVDSAAVKLRLPGRRPASDATPDPATDLTAQLATSGGKGRPTPKRNEAQGRRTGPVPPPPTTRKEAYKRSREQQAAGRGSARAAAARGDESALPARDRGPRRKLVRDVVDARRNAGSFFLVVAALVLLGYFIPNSSVQGYTVFVWFAFFLVILVDSFVLGRKIKKVVTERFPDHPESMRTLIWYGVSRATMIRRWRFPKPQVALGAEV
jgi:cation transport ATPase